MAAPSILMVLPSGMEKLATGREAPRRCTPSRVVDRAAALEQVVKAIIMEGESPFRNCEAESPVNFTQGR